MTSAFGQQCRPNANRQASATWGKLVIAYPSRPSKHSKRGHAQFLPTDPAAREALEKEILDAHRRFQESRP